MLSFHSAAAAMSVLCVLQYCLLFLTYFVAAQFSEHQNVYASNIRLLFRRRGVHISGQLFITMVRADENKKAAEHRFQKWYDEEESSMNRGCHHCNCEDSPLSEVRTRIDEVWPLAC